MVTGRELKVLMVGCDLSSRGGIASVVKAYHSAWIDNPNGIDLRLLKTSYYKDKSILFEMYMAAKAIVLLLHNLLFLRPHIIHIHSSAYISFYRKSVFILLSRLFMRPVILHLHSSQFDDFFLSSSRLRRWWLRIIFSMVSRVVVLCEEWKLNLVRVYGLDNVIKMINPVVLDGAKNIVHRNQNDDRLLVLFMGFLIENKGIRDIIKIADCLMTRSSPVKLIIAGKGELQKELEDAIEEKGLKDVLEFAGWLDGDVKNNMLDSANVFLLPSYNEGMPIAILEAMNHGLAIVSTNIAGIPEEVEKGVNGYLLAPGDVNGFCQVLHEMAINRDLVKSMGVESKALVGRFDSRVVFMEVVNLYRSLLVR